MSKRFCGKEKLEIKKENSANLYLKPGLKSSSVEEYFLLIRIQDPALTPSGRGREKNANLRGNIPTNSTYAVGHMYAFSYISTLLFFQSSMHHLPSIPPPWSSNLPSTHYQASRHTYYIYEPHIGECRW